MIFSFFSRAIFSPEAVTKPKFLDLLLRRSSSESSNCLRCFAGEGECSLEDDDAFLSGLFSVFLGGEGFLYFESSFLSLLCGGNSRRVLDGDSRRVFDGDSLRDLGGDSRRALRGDTRRVLDGDSRRVLGGDSRRVLVGDSRRALRGDLDFCLGDSRFLSRLIDPRRISLRISGDRERRL